MEDLIEKLKAAAGLTEEQAKKSIDVMKEFVKSKVPAGFSDKIDDLLEGKFDMSSLLGGGFGSALDSLKSMFGGKKE